MSTECERFDHDYVPFGEDEDGNGIYMCETCGAERWDE